MKDIGKNKGPLIVGCLLIANLVTGGFLIREVKQEEKVSSSNELTEDKSNIDNDIKSIDTENIFNGLWIYSNEEKNYYYKIRKDKFQIVYNFNREYENLEINNLEDDTNKLVIVETPKEKFTLRVINEDSIKLKYNEEEVDLRRVENIQLALEDIIKVFNNDCSELDKQFICEFLDIDISEIDSYIDKQKKETIQHSHNNQSQSGKQEQKTDITNEQNNPDKKPSQEHKPNDNLKPNEKPSDNPVEKPNEKPSDNPVEKPNGNPDESEPDEDKTDSGESDKENGEDNDLGKPQENPEDMQKPNLNDSNQQ